ncbi:hypothetical protein HD597_000689 [Nonomuraea thailandensis]|uniref:Transposase DDE domain-containing protein n=1 Tax=Nonomuraea thailandensis TaxID=1188745 RepID=A0A9X2G6W1_9ACTN|nr:hypothetical protein [Nonomuraea thailandensis]
MLERIKIRLAVGPPRTRPGAVAADKAYSSRGNRAQLRGRGIKAGHRGEGRPCGLLRRQRGVGDDFVMRALAAWPALSPSTSGTVSPPPTGPIGMP